jgi:L,D-transpeptidase ErfK/SrfK
VVLNLADQRLYVFHAADGTVESVPIGIGKSAWGTPTGRTKVVRKRANPTWYVPKSIRAEDPELPAVVRPGPLNPLGHHAIDLGWPSYLLHGTNRPYGVGRRVSHGCVRLYPEDIARLFTEIPIGMPVTVVNQEVKLAWAGATLMMEAHPSQQQADELEENGNFAPARPAAYEYHVLDAAGAHAARIDWRTVTRALDERTGMPVAILTIATRPNSES